MISFPSFEGLMKHPNWFNGKLQGDGNKKYSEIRMISVLSKSANILFMQHSNFGQGKVFGIKF